MSRAVRKRKAPEPPGHAAGRAARKASRRPAGAQLLRIHREEPPRAYRLLSRLVRRARHHRAGGSDAHGARSYQRHVFHYRKKNGEPLSFTGQHDRIVPLRVWFKWMARHHHILHNPASELELPRLGVRLPKAVLTAAEAEQVIEQTEHPRPAGAARSRHPRDAVLDRHAAAGAGESEAVGSRSRAMHRDASARARARRTASFRWATARRLWVRKYLDESRPQLATRTGRQDRVPVQRRRAVLARLSHRDGARLRGRGRTSASAARATCSATPWRR